MVFKLFPRGNAFNDWFIFVGDFRVEFDIEPFLHWADDQESGAAIKYNTVGCRADEHFRLDKPTRFRPKRMGAKPTWLKPELVCEVGFAEVTSDSVFRQASFKGMRTDKNAKDVVLETLAATEDTVAEVDEKPTVKKMI